MAKIAEVQEVSLKKIRPYERNAKKHNAEQVEKIAESIKEFGFVSPCLIDADFNLIAGHGRLMAAKKLGLKTVPCVFIEGLTDEQRRAYILTDNRLGELAAWDYEIVFNELEELKFSGFDVSLTGFDVPEINADWFEDRENEGAARQDENDEYNEFLEKFEPKKTTDDCYTPDAVYSTVAEWVADEYKLNRADFVRPFYPGGDYQRENYQSGCVVVDNPPFSIMSEIVKFYNEQQQPFFLFAPSLVCMNSVLHGACVVICGAEVTYENGAKIRTAFVTNIEKDNIVRVVPELGAALIEAQKSDSLSLPVYDYPNEVVTAAMLQRLAKYGVSFEIKKNDAAFIRKLDAQGEKAIYGGGLLISEKAAAEKAAAEKAAAEKAAAEKMKVIIWELSDREREIVKAMGGGIDGKEKENAAGAGK